MHYFCLICFASYFCESHSLCWSVEMIHFSSLYSVLLGDCATIFFNPFGAHLGCFHIFGYEV